MRFCAFSSGSSGNCYFVELGGKRLLVDLGLSKKRIEEHLKSIDVDPSTISDVFLTHEHADHVAGVAVWMRAHSSSVYATEGTWKGILSSKNDIPEASSFRLWCDEPFYLLNGETQSVLVTPIPTCHDANDSCGYSFSAEGKTVVILTDTGSVTEQMLKLLEEAEVIVLESNHDLWMLRHGPYPKELVNRIEGCCGHLSNDTCAKVLASLSLNPQKKRYIYLGHLSAENNTSTKALECSFNALNECRPMIVDWEEGVLRDENDCLEIRCCPRLDRTEVLTL